MKGSLALALVLAAATGCKSKPKLLHVFLASPEVAVTRDMGSDYVVLTSRDLTAEARTLATRTFEGTTTVLCDTLPRERLLCEIDRGVLRILDARTLADQEDITNLVKTAFPDADFDADLMSFVVHADGTFDLPIGETTDARVDLATGSVTRVPVTGKRGLRGGDRARCISWNGGTVRNGLHWSIESDKLVRKRPVVEAEPSVAEAEVAPVPAPFRYGSVMDCGPSVAGVLVMSYDGAESRLARLDDEARVRWIARLGAHPSDLFIAGDRILIPTGEAAHRLIAIDLATGTTQWTLRD